MFLTVLFIVFCGQDTLISQSAKVENFIVYSVHGKRTVFFDLFESLPKDGVLILNFTSIYCKPCRKEIPELVAIAGKAGNRAKLVCIYAESGNTVKELAMELNVLDKTYVDPFTNIQKQYNIKKIPVTLVISKNYMNLGRFEGYSADNIKKIETIVLMK
jgi:thiol-disulfide isomerase/thioredoxin